MLRGENPSLMQLEARRQCLRILFGKKDKEVRFAETPETLGAESLQLQSRREIAKIVTCRL